VKTWESIPRVDMKPDAKIELEDTFVIERWGAGVLLSGGAGPCLSASGRACRRRSR
jgi:hypothetical protein